MKTLLRKRLSPTTQELLARLARRPTVAERWFARDGRIEVIQQVGQANEPVAIADLLPFGYDNSRAVRATARSVIAHLYAQIPLEALPLLDEWLRKSWVAEHGWNELKPSAVEAMGGEADADLLCLCLVSCHRNGRVRAAALHAMAEASSAIAIPFLLIRLVDPVREVRALAVTEFRRKLSVANGCAFVDCLALISRLGGNTRYLPEYMTWIEEILKSPMCAGSLWRGVRSPTRELRQHCYRLASVNPAISGSDLIRLALTDPAETIRMWAFTSGAELLPSSRRELMRMAAKDPCGRIRRLAFEAARSDVSATSQELSVFLLDRSATIREDCQAMPTERLGQTPAEFYRDEIRNPAPATVDVCVLGLAECGCEADADVVLGMLAHRSARVRRAAVRALRRLRAVGLTPALLRIVSTEVPSVAREAVSALLSGRTVSADNVRAEALKNADPRVPRIVLRYLECAGKWRRLRLYLQAADSADSELSALGADMLTGWVRGFNNTFVSPTADDIRVSLDLIESAQRHLPPGLARELAFILQTAV